MTTGRINQVTAFPRHKLTAERSPGEPLLADRLRPVPAAECRQRNCLWTALSERREGTLPARTCSDWKRNPTCLEAHLSVFFLPALKPATRKTRSSYRTPLSGRPKGPVATEHALLPARFPQAEPSCQLAQGTGVGQHPVGCAEHWHLRRSGNRLG